VNTFKAAVPLDQSVCHNTTLLDSVAGFLLVSLRFAVWRGFLGFYRTQRNKLALSVCVFPINADRWIHSQLDHLLFRFVNRFLRLLTKNCASTTSQCREIVRTSPKVRALCRARKTKIWNLSIWMLAVAVLKSKRVLLSVTTRYNWILSIIFLCLTDPLERFLAHYAIVPKGKENNYPLTF
jgi:hypothetical protein